MNVQKTTAFILVLFLLALNIPVQAATTTVSTVVDAKKGTVTITGNTAPLKVLGIIITNAETGYVTREVLLQNTYAIGETTSGQNGEYSLTLSFPPTMESGTYKAIVSVYDMDRAETEFHYNKAEYENAFFVDYQSGNDEQNDGSIFSPFKTVAKAQRAVRDYKALAEEDIYVYLREGVHFLEEPLYLDDRDSGSENIKIIYSSFEEEQPIISGGTVIADWELYDTGKNIYEADAGGIVDTRQLYVNGARAQRARSEDYPGIITLGDIGCQGDDVAMAGWGNQSAIELVYGKAFTNARCPVERIEEVDSKALITMQQPGWTYMNDKNRLYGEREEGEQGTVHPWYVENAYELLDEPGEWYLDKGAGKFYYMPLNGENMETAYVVVPRLEKLLEVYGSDLDHFAENIAFNGITFAESTWLRPNTNVGHVDAQNNFLRRGGESEIYRDSLAPAAVMVARARNIYFESCTFTRLGISGINMVDGVQDSVIRGGRFYDISGGAIAIGRANVVSALHIPNPPDERLYLKNILVNNNLIHKVAVEYRSAAAISAGYPVDSEFSHNEISDIPYSGFHIGYDRRQSESNVLSGVRVINNYIYNILNDVLYDGGAIYTNGKTGASAENPNIISGNYIKDQYSDSHVLYNDNTSQYWHHTNNVIDLRGQERTKWYNGRIPTWAGCTIYGDYKGITYQNNFTTTQHNRLEGREPERCTVADTHIVPGAEWSQEAWDIINRAGLTPEYDKNYCKNIDFSEKITHLGAWSMEGGRVTMKTMSLADGESAVYNGESFAAHILHFNMTLQEENSRAKFSLKNQNGDRYDFVLEEHQIRLYNGSGTLLESGSTVITAGQRNRIALTVKGNEDSTLLSMTVNETDAIEFVDSGIKTPLSFSAEAENGGVSFGRAEQNAEHASLLKNHSFEQPSAFATTNTTEWYRNVNASVSTCDTDSVTGEKSAKITITGAFAGLNQYFTLDREKYYDVSVWVKLLEFADEGHEDEYNYGQILLTRYHEGGVTNYAYLATNTPLVVGEWIQLRAAYRNDSNLNLTEVNNSNIRIRIGTGQQLCTYLIDDFWVREVVPEALNLEISGDFTPGGTIALDYDYHNEYGIAEADSYYELYLSDNADFESKNLIKKGFLSGKKIPEITLPFDGGGSYIKLAVTPIDSMGLCGKTVETEPVYVEELPIALRYDETGGNYVFKVAGTDLYSEEMGTIVLAAYKNRLLVEVDVSGEGITIDKDRMQGYVLKAFLWKDFHTLLPVCRNIKVEF